MELENGKPGYISTRLKITADRRITDIELSADTSPRVVAEYVWMLDPAVWRDRAAGPTDDSRRPRGSGAPLLPKPSQRTLPSPPTSTSPAIAITAGSGSPTQCETALRALPSNVCCVAGGEPAMGIGYGAALPSNRRRARGRGWHYVAALPEAPEPAEDVRVGGSRLSLAGSSKSITLVSCSKALALWA